MMNDRASDMAANAVCYAVDTMKEVFMQACNEYMRPSTVYKPTLNSDGKHWYAMLGVVYGSGDSPAEAMTAFDVAWCTKIEKDTE